MKKKILSIICITFIVCALLVFAVSCNKEVEEPITTYSIWLDIQDDNTVECSQKVEIVNNYGVAIDELKFNVYSNAFDKRKPLPCAQEEQGEFYPDGISYGEFSLKSLYGEIKQYDFDFDSNIISVELNSPLEVGQRTSVDMQYTITLPHTNGRYGFNEKGISLTGFYPMLCAFIDGEWYYDEYSPIGDPYFSDVAKYEVTFNLPSGWEYVSSGKSKRSEENGETIVSSIARNIRDFALILSPTLNKSVSNYDGVEISYLGEKSETLEIAKKALEVYGNLFGKYSYDTLAIADMPFVAGGMEYGALCVINASLGGATYEEVVAHEIAHQWWYGAVGSNNLTEAWQDEGLTSYATYLYFVTVGNVEYSSLMMNDAYSQFHRFLDIQNSVGESAKGKLGGRLNDFPSNYYYTNITYNKSLVMWKYMQDTLGKDTILKALQEYYSTYKLKIATPDNLYACLDNAFADASALMKNWVASV